MTVMARYQIKRRRPRRVREASPEYGAPAQAQAYAVTVADRGRLVLPAEVRERLHIKEGDRLTLRVEPDGTLMIQTAEVYANSLVGMFKHLAPGRSLGDELIAERRREAAMEERETRGFLARRRQTRKTRSD
jgi:AbrB family looped-hinge helix DNA binding protein